MIINDKLDSEESNEQQQPTPESEDKIKEAASTAQEVKKEEGIITQIGQAIANAFDPDESDRQAVEATKAIYEGLGGKVDEQKYDEVLDSMPTAEETEAQLPKPVAALAGGMQDGIMTPVTALAAVTNQEATWDDRPSVLTDDDWFSNTIYEVSKILTPTLIFRKFGLGAGLGVQGQRSIESAIETASIDSMDDLTGGRSVSEAYGKMWGAITGDEAAGIQLTTDLIEGNKASIQPLLKTHAFLQTYAINALGEGTVRVLGNVGKRLLRNIADSNGSLEEIAKMQGKSVDETAESMTVSTAPEYTPDVDPQDMVTPQTNGTLKPSKGNQVNEEAMLKKVLADVNGTPLDPEDPANFFYNWGALSEDEATQIAIKSAFLGKVAPEAGSIARSRLIQQTAKFLAENKSLIETDKDAFLLRLAERAGIQDRNPGVFRRGANRYSQQALAELSNFESYFGKYMEIDISTPEGLMGVATMRYLAEQGGLQLRNAADQYALLKSKGLDAQANRIAENIILPNQRFLRNVLSPFRKAKRNFFLLGEAQQSQFYQDVAAALGEEPASVKTLLEETTLKGNVKKSASSLRLDGKAIKIAIEGEDFKIDTLEQIYGLAIQGNEQAKQIFDLAMDNIRFGDPGKTIDNMNIVTDIIAEALKTKQGAERYFYNFVALGQFSTQTNAVSATVFRQSLEPLALAIAGVNPMVRSVGREDAIYGMGMWLGGLWHAKSAFGAGMRAMKTNNIVSGNTRFERSYTGNLVKELKEIKALHQKDYMNRVAKGENPLITTARWVGDRSREFAYTRFANLPTRLLMASDEAAKLTAGAQHAWGRALVNLSQRGEWRPEQMLAQIKLEEEKIFKGPVWKGEIADQQVKAASERQTLQQKLDPELDNNAIADFFLGQQKANDVSFINRIFNAFPRVAYRSLEQEFVENVGGTFGLRLTKRLQDIYAMADKDPTQKLAVEGQKSLAQLVGFSVVAGSLISKMGDVQDALGIELPRVEIYDGNIIVEGEDYDYAIEFGKFSPASVLLALYGQAIESFVEGSTSEQDLMSKTTGMIQGLFADMIDRNLLQGLQNQARVTDVDNPAWSKNVFGWLWDFISPGVVREIAEVIQPKATIQDVRTSRVSEILGEGARQGFGNIQNPKLYDIYAQEPKDGKPRAAGGTRMSALASLFWPGRVTAKQFYDPVHEMMRKSDFETNTDFVRRVYNVELTAAEQSLLSQSLQGPLYTALDKFRKDTYPGLLENYKKVAKKNGYNSDEARRAYRAIGTAISRVHFTVKDNVIMSTPGLADSPRLTEAIEAERERRRTENKLMSSRQGMYQTAANQSTELASQVRNILDIPT
jgi:hypothetical protein